jgi:branched-chain amino acid transport system permease protein
VSLVKIEAGSRRHLVIRWVVIIVAVLVAIGLPLNSTRLINSQLTLVMIYGIAALGLNLLVGYSGQISLGHGAFFAIGAYTAAIVIVRAGMPYLVAILAAGLVTFALGFAFGVPALRLRGLYLALVTLALTVVTPPLIKRFGDLTGGAQGMSVPTPAVPSWLKLDADQFLYLLVLVVTGVLFLVAMNLTRGGMGRALISIRDNEHAAITMGVDRARLKTRVFACSAAYAGIAGGLFALALGFVAPESFTLALSFVFLAAIVIGGLGTIGGALLGALFIEFVPQYAGEVNPALAGLIYGTVLIVVMYLLPGGAMGLLRDLRRRLVEVVEAPRPAPPAAGGAVAAVEPAAEATAAPSRRGGV